MIIRDKIIYDSETCDGRKGKSSADINHLPKLRKEYDLMNLIKYERSIDTLDQG